MPIITGLNANVFRAISGSLFSSPINWSRGIVPTGSDVAFIADNCVIDINRTVGSLVVQPGFTASINTGLTLQVNNAVNVLGQISCSGNPTIFSLARKNIINSLSPGTSTFHFSGSLQQNIPGLTYYNLTISAPSGSPGVTKPLTSSDLIVSGGLTIRGANVLDLNRYNLIVSGTTILDAVDGNFLGRSNNRSAVMAKSYLGSIIFYGPIAFAGNGVNNGFDLQNGNPSVDIYNGIGFNDDQIYFDSGKGNWTFRGNNNQSVSIGGGALPLFNSSIIISGSTAVTMSTSPFNYISFNNIVNGTEASSSLKLSGRIYFTNIAAAIPMVTGTFDYTGSTNLLGYIFSDSFTLPYSYYDNLLVGVAGGSIKTINKNLSVSSSLQMNGGNLELGNFNLSVSGSTLFSNFSSGAKITKSGPGYVTFIGNLSYGCCNGDHGVDFSVGNPTVEFQNGIFYGDTGANRFNLGTGSIRFTTRNQLINQSGANSTMSFYGPISIENIAVTNSLGNAIYLYAPVNGTTAGSTFKNNTNLYFSNSASLSGSFLTGTLDLSTANNTIGLVGNYSATIPSRFSTFSNLAISGTGTKTMSTSSVISGSLSMGTTGSIELGNNNLILLGNMGGPNDFSNRAWFSKSGSGNIIFAGNITPNCVNFNLPGNPTVEFRNGANLVNVSFFNFGTGSVTFSTNNQTFQGNSTFNLSGSLIVSGGITLTLATFAGGGRMNIYNTIDGTTGSSVLVNNTSMYFYNSSSYIPMATSGTFSYLNPLSSLGYMFDKDIQLPYTQYNNVYVAGTKSLAGDTYVSGGMGFDIDGVLPGRLELSSSSLFVSGGFGSNTNNTFISKNSNIGALIFNGPVNTNGQTWQLTGNPTAEFRNGLSILNPTFASQTFGTGSFIFSTRNQTIQCNGGLTFGNTIIISGAINLTLNGFSGAGNHTFSGSINGTDPNSRLTIAASGGTPTITYYNSQRPMLTGSIDFSSSLNTFIYASGSQNVKGGTYRNLTFLNGLKTLQGNVSVLGTFSTGSGATSASINLNGFTLTNP